MTTDCSKIAVTESAETTVHHYLSIVHPGMGRNRLPYSLLRDGDNLSTDRFAHPFTALLRSLGTCRIVLSQISCVVTLEASGRVAAGAELLRGRPPRTSWWLRVNQLFHFHTANGSQKSYWICFYRDALSGSALCSRRLRYVVLVDDF